MSFTRIFKSYSARVSEPTVKCDSIALVIFTRCGISRDLVPDCVIDAESIGNTKARNINAVEPWIAWVPRAVVETIHVGCSPIGEIGCIDQPIVSGEIGLVVIFPIR